GECDAKTALQDIAHDRFVSLIGNQRDRQAARRVVGVALDVGAQPIRPTSQRGKNTIICLAAQCEPYLTWRACRARCHWGSSFIRQNEPGHAGWLVSRTVAALLQRSDQ